MDGESECPPLSCCCGMIVDSGGKAISASARALLGRFVARREAMLRWCLGRRHEIWIRGVTIFDRFCTDEMVHASCTSNCTVRPTARRICTVQPYQIVFDCSLAARSLTIVLVPFFLK